MSFQIIRNDITKIYCDAIVNTANPRPVVGTGTDAAIHKAAGPMLLQARQQIGKIPAGTSVITPGFRLPARFVIHTVGPVWRGGLFGEARKLRSCYDSALELALKAGCQSIAFPLISSGNYGFPKEKALEIATQAFSDFLLENDMTIWLVVFDRESFRLSESLHRSISSYIDEHYVQEKVREEYDLSVFEDNNIHRRRREEDFAFEESWDAVDSCSNYGFFSDEPTHSVPMEVYPPCPEPDASRPAASAPTAVYPGAVESRKQEAVQTSHVLSAPQISLADLLIQTDAGFSETLLKLIDRTGKKDSAIYSRANVSRQHFSKIRNNPAYQPTKATAIAFAIALELNLEETKDLIGRAGFALTRSSVFDVIIMYFIDRRNYNIHDINAALFEFDQSLLG